MKAIILAAGKGLRLMPFTKKTHKSLLKINKKTIIRRQIETLRKVGIKEIAVVVGYKEEQLRSELGNEVKYFYNPFYETTDSVVSLWFAKDFLRGGDVLVLNGDILVESSILRDLIKSRGEMCVVVDTNKWNKDGYKVKIKNNLVVDMSMDIKRKEVSGEYAGMTKIVRKKLENVVEMLDRYVHQGRFGDWYETAFVSMIREGTKIRFIPTNKRWWIEADFLKDLKSAEKYFKMMKNE